MAQVRITHLDGTVDEITTSGNQQINVQQGDKIEVLNATLTSATVDGNNYVVTLADPVSGTVEITFVDLFLLLAVGDPTQTAADATTLSIAGIDIANIGDALGQVATAAGPAAGGNLGGGLGGQARSGGSREAPDEFQAPDLGTDEAPRGPLLQDFPSDPAPVDETVTPDNEEPAPPPVNSGPTALPDVYRVTEDGEGSDGEGDMGGSGSNFVFGDVIDGDPAGTPSGVDSDPEGDILFVTEVSNGTTFGDNTGDDDTEGNGVDPIGFEEVDGDYGLLQIIPNDEIDSEGRQFLYQLDNTDPDVQALGVGETTTDTFVYRISDGNGGTDTTTLTIVIEGTNDGPVARNDTNAVDAVTTGTATDATGIVVGTETNNSGEYSYADIDHGADGTDDADSDIDGDQLTVVQVSNGTTFGNNTSGDDTEGTGADDSLADNSEVTGDFGTLTISSDGSYSYDLDETNATVISLDSGETETDTFVYKISDGFGGTDTATLTITINGAADGPVARDDTNAVDAVMSGTATNATGNVLGTETGPDTVTGDYSYADIDHGADGLDDADSDADGDQLAVIHVSDGTTFGDNTGGDDTEGDGTAAIAANSEVTGDYGTLTISADGSYSYDLDETNGTIIGLDDGETETDTFVYKIWDGVDTATAELTITINGTNDGPVARDDTNAVDAVTTGTATNATGNVLGTETGPDTVTGDYSYADIDHGADGLDDADSDVDGDQLAVIHVSDGTTFGDNTGGDDTEGDGTAAIAANSEVTGDYGTLTISADGSYSYDLDETNGTIIALDDLETATDTFVYKIWDGTKTDTATLKITINGTNDAPVASADTNWAQEDGVDASGNVLGTEAFNDPDYSYTNIDHAGAPLGTFTDVADSDADGDQLTVTGVTYYGADGAVGGGDDIGGTVNSGLVSDYGTLTLNADGSYDYIVDDTNADVQLLGVGDTLTETYSYTVTDGDDTDTATLSITIFGEDDQARVLNGSITTNTNVANQFALLMFFDPAQMINSYSKFISLDAQGQEGNFAEDAGFVIDGGNGTEYAVSMEHAFGTKVIITEVTLEGVTLVNKNTQLEEDGAFPNGGKQFALTGTIDPESSQGAGDGSVIQAETASTDGDPAGADTITDAGGDGINYLFGSDGIDSLVGSGDTDVLNGGGGADELYGMGGNDMLVYDSLDTVIDGGDGQDALRIDGDPLATIDSPVNLNGEPINDIEVILLTEDAQGEDSLGAADGSGDPDIGIDLTFSDQDVLDFTDGDNELWIVGTAGDELVVTDESSTVWSDGGPHDVNGAEFQHYIGDNGQNLYVDTDIATTITIV